MNEDDKMTDAALSSLKSLRFAQPSPEAKKIALNAAMVAFDAAQASKTKPAAAGTNWLSRWKLGAGLGIPAATAVDRLRAGLTHGAVGAVRGLFENTIC